jgi:hypothetical protein
MENELYELIDSLKEAGSGKEYMAYLLKKREENKERATDAMNYNNLMYIVGAIDALYYAGKIDQKEYTMYINKLVYNR